VTVPPGGVGPYPFGVSEPVRPMYLNDERGEDKSVSETVLHQRCMTACICQVTRCRGESPLRVCLLTRVYSQRCRIRSYGTTVSVSILRAYPSVGQANEAGEYEQAAEQRSSATAAERKLVRADDIARAERGGGERVGVRTRSTGNACGEAAAASSANFISSCSDASTAGRNGGTQQEDAVKVDAACDSARDRRSRSRRATCQAAFALLHAPSPAARRRGALVGELGSRWRTAAAEEQPARHSSSTAAVARSSAAAAAVLGCGVVVAAVGLTWERAPSGWQRVVQVVALWLLLSVAVPGPSRVVCSAAVSQTTDRDETSPRRGNEPGETLPQQDSPRRNPFACSILLSNDRSQNLVRTNRFGDCRRRAALTARARFQRALRFVYELCAPRGSRVGRHTLSS
jgi:hypothetical protein